MWVARSKDPVYRKWRDMIRRCTAPTAKGYASYGGRGITVCDNWLLNFEAFKRDMGELPTRAHQLDRIDNNKGYSPSNCRWVTPSKNAANRPPNRASGHFRGVEARHGKFRTALICERTHIRAGTFSSEEEAAWMYDQFAICLWGDDAYTNFTYERVVQHL